MKTLKIGLMTAAIAASLASTQGAIVFLGSINDGVSPSVANEVAWVNHIINQAVSTTDLNVSPGSETTIRSGNANPGSGTVSTPPASQIKTFSDPSVTAGGFDYLIAHWGGQEQMSAVWYLGGAAFDVPDNQTDMAALFPGFGFSKGGYSGYTVYNATTTRVPDGGATVALLGLGSLALAAFRRK